VATHYRIFAAVAPGLEPFLAEELRTLPGVRCPPALAKGGVELVGPRETLWGVALCSRLAEGLRVRLGQAFRAASFAELEARLMRLAWAAFVGRGGSMPRIRVTCRRSRLYHSGAVEERIARVLSRRLGCRPVRPEERSGLTVFARLEHDRVQISVDATGEPLHRRGYRLEAGQAPLRETLAAALLQAAGYRGDRPLWDPFCGAGTICLEAAAVAARVWPGMRRSFSFEAWPTHDSEAFHAFRDRLPGPVAPAVPVLGSDRDPAVLEAACHNAQRAGLAAHVVWLDATLRLAVNDAADGAMVVSNPPYGRRLSAGPALRRTFGQLGAILRERPDLRPVVLLAAHPELMRKTALPWRCVATLNNRGVPVGLLRLDS
jgi:putative N6-adenine-specific DNA methylase